MANVFSSEVTVTNPISVDNFPATQPVSGTVAVSNFPATQPVSATDLDIRDLNSATDSVAVTDGGGSVTIDGTVAVSNFPGGSSATANVTNVSVGASSTLLIASNASRKFVLLHNEAGTLFVKYGSGASSTSYSLRLTANTSATISQYTGDVYAIKASGTSAVLVTEGV